MLLLPTARADEVLVAVAANFAAPMQQLAPQFTARSGYRARITLGASGALYAQIHHGAPYAVLLSADRVIPERLLDEGLAVPASRFTYARGRLALWSADPQRLDGSDTLLRSGRFQRLAIANPRHAPYGAAAHEVLDALGIRLSAGQTLLRGESISQTYQFVATGNAELGFIALSQVWREGALTHGSLWRVPASLHAPLDQDAVLLLPGRDLPAARALLDFLRSDEARALIASFGYETPADA